MPAWRDGYEADVIMELDFLASGITHIVWAMNYGFACSLVRLPIFDDDGYPRQERGVTMHPGLYFVGLNWMHTAKSAVLFGVGEDAEHVTSHIMARSRP